MEQSIIYTDNELQLAMDNMVRGLDYFFDDITEIRIPKTKHDGVVSGYFNDPDAFMDCAFTYFGKSNVYITVNPLDTSQIQVKVDNKLHAVTKKNETTSDKQIQRRKWFLLDFDPVRSNGENHCSSTDEEWQRALNSARECREWLSEQGWPDPILASSGNGGHLVYRIDLPNTREDTVLIEQCLQALKQRYDTETVLFDTSVSNPSRIWKLYGTMAVKGPNTDERPHRLATILEAPEPHEIEIVPVEKLKELADLAPKATAQQSGLRKIKSIIAGERSRGFGAFDNRRWLETWIANSGLDVESVRAWNDGTKWILTSCPYEAHFNETDHREPNKAYITLTDDGIGAGCQSGNCKALYDERGAWKTLRDIVEPGWEERREEKRQKNEAKKQTPGRPKKDVAELVAQIQEHGLESFTDTGNARRLVSLHGENLRCTSQFGWLVWDEARWTIDDTGQVERFCKDTAERIQDEALLVDPEEEKELYGDILRHANSSLNQSRLDAMKKNASTEAEIRIRHNVLDANPWLFNGQNGTLDLQTGTLRPHHRADHITKLASVVYNPDATCLNWFEFLDQIFQNDWDLIGYVQRIFGYALTGDISWQCLFLLHGSGQNGKSVLLDVLRLLVGDYGAQTDFNTFMVKRNNDTTRNDLAQLVNRRVVCGSEGDIGQHISEALIKQVTGENRVNACFKYKEPFEYDVTFKVFLATNHLPNITGQDKGIWRRLRVIPFRHEVPDDQREPRLIEDKLAPELSGILNWALEGCRQWLEGGEQIPRAVVEATGQYREDMDPFGLFLNDCFDLDDPTAETPTGKILEMLKDWAQENHPPLAQITAKGLAGKMAEKSIEKSPNKNKRGYQGLRPKYLAERKYTKEPTGLNVRELMASLN